MEQPQKAFNSQGAAKREHALESTEEIERTGDMDIIKCASSALDGRVRTSYKQEKGESSVRAEGKKRGERYVTGGRKRCVCVCVSVSEWMRGQHGCRSRERLCY